jgi:hypothetical protein
VWCLVVEQWTRASDEHASFGACSQFVEQLRLKACTSLLDEGGCVSCLVFCVVLHAWTRVDDLCAVPFGGPWLGLLFLLSVCVTSYKGHMVDALASRADEGRTSLR